MRRAIRRALTGAVLATVACVSPALRGGGGRGWIPTLDDAKQAVIAGRYDDADSVLAKYATAHAGSSEAYEAAYWRAVFLLDPGNHTGSLAEGTVLLDDYLAGSPSLPHRREAVTLRRLAAELQTTRKLAAANTETPTAAPRTIVVDDKSKDEEVERLRAQLAKANDELERIRKRLTAKP